MRYLIIGFARSGKAAASLLAEACGSGEINIWDSRSEEDFNSEEIAFLREKGVNCLFGGTLPSFGWDELILSPGVPRDLPFVLDCERSGSLISGEIELAYENCRGEFFAITGTNGKTTVTTLVGEMVKAAKRRCMVVGNIGNPATEVCRSAGEDTVMVTEISSFQLETVHSFHPHISALLNITPDHLDRHKTFENYADIKSRITLNQDASDYFIYNADDELCRAAAAKTNANTVPFSGSRELEYGIFVKNGRIVIKDKEKEAALCRAADLQIPGHHNLENALAAAGIAYFGGIGDMVIASVLESFKGVAHRIEFIREYNGVRYVNDSKGTNPDSSIKAIEATSAPIILIAGGYEKNSDFHEFIGSFNGKVKELLLLGATAERFRDTAVECGYPAGHIRMCVSMKDCVQKASLLAAPGDTVLLSPASASWGMYKNFEERGDDFRNLVNMLR